MKRRAFLGAMGTAALAGCVASGVSDKGPIRAKVDLHSHIYHDGSEFDEEVTTGTAEMVAAYEELDFDVLCGTDHHYELAENIPGKPTSDQVHSYGHLDFDGPILDGVELSAGPHINLIRSENEEIRQINHPHGGREEILDLAERTGAELIEVMSRGRLLDYPTPTDVATDLPGLKPTMTTDAHCVEELRENQDSHVIVEVPRLTGDEVIRALRRGDYSLASQHW